MISIKFSSNSNLTSWSSTWE